ncbi:hypothetical protein CTEN210_18473 [Chaetoceros tenuissimus]|uniref:PHD-type domain-containing protein n=1 Tax=Chaetoceros tenuissimus TaxID=426638 RepID=A0AAD3HFH2_9STRA|nr:hypothetical protein CTEN210_18473 [Chaetoceros tenuissimus]
MSESRGNGRERSKGDLSKLNKNRKRDRLHPSITCNETHERLGNVSEISRELTRVNLESYIGKKILKDFGGTTTLGTTYVGTITQLLKDEDDGTPFLQVTYEDGDQEEFVEEDMELLDELIEEYDLRESPTKFAFDKNLICDICNKGDGYKDMTMQKCSECGVAVHEDCYSINSYAFLGGRKWKQWKCHACASVGHTISAIRQSNSHIEQVTVRKRPVHCALCNFHSGNHAMHPFYNTHGSNGLPYLAVNSQEEGVQWVHTLCALALSTHEQFNLIYYCNDEGKYELDNENKNDEESRISNEDELEDRSHLDFNYRKGDYTLVTTTTHRYVLNLEIKRAKGLKKLCQDYTCIVCDKNSHHSQMIAVKCGNRKHECKKAFHIGCAKWGNTNVMIYHTEKPLRWYVCCSKGCKSRFRKELADGDFSELDNSLEARRMTENVGKQYIDEDFVSRDEEDEEQKQSDKDNVTVSSTTKKSRKCTSQTKKHNDSLISNSEKHEIREKERAENCLKMKVDLEARLKYCDSINKINRAFDECKSHFRNQESIPTVTFNKCWEESREDLERMVKNKRKEIESSLKGTKKPRKAKKKNNENQWDHLFVNRGFQMGDPRSRLDNTSSE